jgi:hypothetical protein
MPSVRILKQALAENNYSIKMTAHAEMSAS